MSGGSLNYFYFKVEEVAYELLEECEDDLRREFCEHLLLVSKALKDIEWVDSGDCSEGSEIESIKKVLKK